VSFLLKNSGKMEGSEIVQLYIQDVKSSVERPVKELKNFIKVKLQPGEKVKVELEIDQLDLSYYDEALSSWVAEPGTFDILIGSSSKDIKLQGSFELTE
jgi:beta-glucosidase